MKRHGPRAVALAVLAVSLGLLLYVLAREQVREALVRVYNAAAAVASAIPQPIYWGMLIAIILVSALRSLLGEVAQDGGRAAEPAGGRVAEWREWLERSALPAGSRHFYRWQVARGLTRLDSEALAHQWGIPVGEAERWIEDGDIALPEEVRRYFVASLRSRPTRSGPWWAQLAGPSGPHPLDLNPERAVEYIESQMEVPDDDSHP